MPLAAIVVRPAMVSTLRRGLVQDGEDRSRQVEGPDPGITENREKFIPHEETRMPVLVSGRSLAVCVLRNR